MNSFLTTVERALKTIYEASPPEITNSPVSDYGLFIPNQRGRKPRWLANALTLDAADVTSQVFFLFFDYYSFLFSFM